MLNSVQNGCDVRAEKWRKALGATKQGYLWIAGRSVHCEVYTESPLGKSKVIVLGLAQVKVAVDRRE